MKFEVRNSVIRPAIATASTVIGRAMLPILNNVRLDLRGGLLTITGSNIEQTVSTTIEVNGIESGSATVPAKKLLALLGSIQPEVTIRMECDEEKSHCNLTAGSGKFKLLGLPADDFPMPDTSDANALHYIMDGATLGRMIREVRPAAAVNEARVVMNGIAFEFMDDHEFNTIATDGKRMAISNSMGRSDTCEEKKMFILPVNAVAPISRITGDFIHIMVKEKTAMFTDQNTSVITKLIEGNYPNYRAVCPTTAKYYADANAEICRGLIGMIATVAGDDDVISLEFSENKILFRAESAATGSGSDAVACDCNCTEPMEIRLKAGYLRDAIADSEEIVSFRFNSPGHPVEVARRNGSKTIIMPVRIK